MTGRLAVTAMTVAMAAGAATPKFEAVSVKTCRMEAGPDGARMGNAPRVSPNRLILTCMSLRQIVREAYLLYPEGRFNPMAFEQPIKGGPGWIDQERYTIEARTESRIPPGIIRGPMMQAVLEERFGLRVRRETRAAPVYHLVVAKGGPKLKRFDGSCISVSDFSKEEPPPDPRQCRNTGTATSRDWKGMSIDNLVLAFLLPGIVGRPVINRTGIEGLYDIHLDFSMDGTGDYPAIPAALEQQLGLRLVPARGTREFLIIERVGRPTEN
jgi:uncharacterized protein (TIGR03435 family)